MSFALRVGQERYIYCVFKPHTCVFKITELIGYLWLDIYGVFKPHTCVFQITESIGYIWLDIYGTILPIKNLLQKFPNTKIYCKSSIRTSKPEKNMFSFTWNLTPTATEPHHRYLGGCVEIFALTESTGGFSDVHLY